MASMFSVIPSSKHLGYIDFSNFNNTAGAFSKLIVPNIVHYIVFDEVTISFPVFISILRKNKSLDSQKVLFF